MNREHVLFHLREAEQELARTIADLESDSQYDYPEFVVAITHAYHHINTAWNARDADPRRANASCETDFARWRQFPSDLDLFV